MKLAVICSLERLGDPLANLLHLSHSHAASRQGWSSNTNSTWIHRLASIKRNHVHIDGNAASIQNLFGSLASQADTGNVDKHQVIVGTATDQSQTGREQFASQCLALSTTERP